MTPRRIQMSRQKPWRAEHPDAVIVDRRTKWGNPFRVGGSYVVWPDGINTHHDCHKEAVRRAVEYFRAWVSGRITGLPIDGLGSIADIRRELAGRDLACWCPLDDGRGNRVPCHADVLLELANPGWTCHADVLIELASGGTP